MDKAKVRSSKAIEVELAKARTALAKQRKDAEAIAAQAASVERELARVDNAAEDGNDTAKRRLPELEAEHDGLLKQHGRILLKIDDRATTVATLERELADAQTAEQMAQRVKLVKANQELAEQLDAKFEEIMPLLAKYLELAGQVVHINAMDGVAGPNSVESQIEIAVAQHVCSLRPGGFSEMRRICHVPGAGLGPRVFKTFAEYNGNRALRVKPKAVA